MTVILFMINLKFSDRITESVGEVE